MCSGSYPAYFGEGTKLTVLEKDHPVTPPEVTVFPPSEYECRDPKDHERKKTLVCLAKDFYPDHVTVSWLKNGEEVKTGVATDPDAEREDKVYKITSRLTVTAETWFDPANEFTCHVRFFNGTHYVDHNETIAGEQAPDVGLTNEKYMKVTHKVKLSYVIILVKSCAYGAFVVFLVWKLQGSKGK